MNVQTNTQTEVEIASGDTSMDIFERSVYYAINDADGLSVDKEIAKEIALKIVQRDVQPDRWPDMIKIAAIVATLLTGAIGSGGAVKLYLTIRFQNRADATMNQLLKRGYIKAGAKVEIDDNNMKLTIDTTKA